MRFVSVKSLEQQELQFVHRVRSRYIKQRTALSNEIRGFLREYGIVLPRGLSAIRRLPELLESHSETISSMANQLYLELYEEFLRLDEKAKSYDRQLREIAKHHPVCSALMQIPGIGPVIATALISSVGNA